MKMPMTRYAGGFALKVAIATCILISGITTPVHAETDEREYQLSHYIWNPMHAMQHLSGDADLYSQPWWLSHKAIYYSMGLETFLSSDKRQLKIRVHYSSFENGGDYSSFRSTKTYTLFTAPDGFQIEDYPEINCYRTIAKRGMHEGMFVRHSGFTNGWNGYQNTPDVAIYINGDAPGTDSYQGYVIYLGDSWTVRTKRVASTIPRWNRFPRR